jgi:hypothetical protein
MAATLKELVQIDESEALSFPEIAKVLTGRFGRGKTIFYCDLETIKGPYTREKLIGHHDCAAVLVSANLGGGVQRHWTALIKHKKGFSFFDSLGMTYKTLDHLLGDSKLTNFLREIKAEPSTRKLQSHSRKVRTCGCHIACRMAFNEKTNSEYVKFITSDRHRTVDETVVTLCCIGLLN